jgi:methoxymalonate biosynthesis acyl carrier protein
MNAIEEELHGYIVGELTSGPGGDSIAPDDDLIRRGIVDSLGVQQLVDFCESRYGIRVDEDDLVLDNFRTLRQLAAFVERKQAEPASPGRPRHRPRRP